MVIPPDLGICLGFNSDAIDLFRFSPATLQSVIEGQLANRIFWPAMAASSVVLVMRNRSRIGKVILPPHITCLLAFLAFAGASALWAFKPELSFIRFTQEAMLLTGFPARHKPRPLDQ